MWIDIFILEPPVSNFTHTSDTRTTSMVLVLNLLQFMGFPPVFFQFKPTLLISELGAQVFELKFL